MYYLYENLKVFLTTKTDNLRHLLKKQIRKMKRKETNCIECNRKNLQRELKTALLLRHKTIRHEHLNRECKHARVESRKILPKCKGRNKNKTFRQSISE